MKQSILGDANANNNNNNNNRGFHSYKNNRNYKKSPSTASMLLLNCGRKSHQRRKKIKPQPFSSPDEILTYEEVALYYPRPNFKVCLHFIRTFVFLLVNLSCFFHFVFLVIQQRPIVLIGPTNIGRHELRQRLMLDTERFAAAIPHTSRLRRDGEIDGIDYHFISRTQFEQDIRDGQCSCLSLASSFLFFLSSCPFFVFLSLSSCHFLIRLTLFLTREPNQLRDTPFKTVV